MSTHAAEVEKGERFAFGANWERFLSVLDEARIKEAEQSLLNMLGEQTLAGKMFLDVGCGSGLFSLAARRLGATVRSFDFDPQSVACARELKRRYFPNEASWVIEEGSILDDKFVQSLGTFDIVYPWGVLHHTGDMRKALKNAASLVKPDGKLYLAIYNDQGRTTTLWRGVKKAYCKNTVGKAAVTTVFVPYFFLRTVAGGVAKLQNPVRYFADYKKRRGMSAYHDWFDWLGGYPFEVAKPEEIFRLYRDAGFELTNLATTSGLGCNQYVFRRLPAPGADRRTGGTTVPA